jgi:hypothetical protein
MLSQILGPLIGGIGSAVSGGSGQSAIPQVDPQEMLATYLESMNPVWAEETKYVKQETKDTRKKANNYFKSPQADQDRLEKETIKNYDSYFDSAMDSVMRGYMSPDQLYGEQDEWESNALMNPGSVINDKGDTSFSKKAAARKKINEEYMPMKYQANANQLAATIMGRALNKEESDYYTNANYFSNPEDVATAMMFTEEGSMRMVDPELRRHLILSGGRLVNPSAKNPRYLPQAMQNKSEMASVNAARNA